MEFGPSLEIEYLKILLSSFGEDFQSQVNIKFATFKLWLLFCQ